jgi:probable F420-dependent oxidoreductase
MQIDTDADLDHALDRLFQTIRLKSISTDPAFAAETRACAEWHAADLQSIGFDASVRDTPGHPVVLAKELATLDVLSEGRLEIGIGAGWMISDYEQSGIPYDPARVRIDRFEEGLEIIKQAMGPEAFSFTGGHYSITDYNGTPKPVQAPCPPILIGGGGKRVLGIAARQADIVGINATMHSGVVGRDTFSTMTAEAVDDKVAIVREAAGDRFDQIEMNIRAFLVSITPDRAGAMAMMAGALGVEIEMIEQTPFALIGPPEALIDDLLARRERWGFSYVIVGEGDVDAFAPVVAAHPGR